jgi:hypothetical protein
MQRQEAGPAVVLYPPIDDDDNNNNEVATDDVATRASPSCFRSRHSSCFANGEGSFAGDGVLSPDRRRRRLGDGEEFAVSTASRSGGALPEPIGAGGNIETTVGTGAAARHMSRDLATKFEALKRRKANGDAIQDCHVALAEEALGMASAEIERMQRACAELEGRLIGGDPEQQLQQPLPIQQQQLPQGRVRNPNGRNPGRRASRQRDADNNDDDEFPLLLPRVVIVTSSEHSRSSSLDANDVGPYLDPLHDMDPGNQDGDDDPSELESRGDS